MAIDTRSKRASVLGIAQAITLTLPLSDGTVGQPDRQHVAYCYPGVTASAPVTVGPDIWHSFTPLHRVHLSTVAIERVQVSAAHVLRIHASEVER